MNIRLLASIKAGDIPATLDSAWRLMPWLPRGVAAIFVGRDSLDASGQALADGEPDIAASLLADHYRLTDHFEARYAIPWAVASDLVDAGLRRGSRHRLDNRGERAYQSVVADLFEWLGYADGMDGARPADRPPPPGAERAVPADDPDAPNEYTEEYIGRWCGTAYDRGLLFGLAERHLVETGGISSFTVVAQELALAFPEDDEWPARRIRTGRKLMAAVVAQPPEDRMAATVCARHLRRHIERRWAALHMESALGPAPSAQDVLAALRFNADASRTTRTRYTRRHKEVLDRIAAERGLSPRAINQAVSPRETRLPVRDIPVTRARMGVFASMMKMATTHLPTFTGTLASVWRRDTDDRTEDSVGIDVSALHRISEASIAMDDRESGAVAAAERLLGWSPATLYDAPVDGSEAQLPLSLSSKDPWARAADKRTQAIHAARAAAGFLRVHDSDTARHMRAECMIALQASPAQLETIERWALSYMDEATAAQGLESDALMARFHLLTDALDARASMDAYALMVQAQTNDRPEFTSPDAASGRTRWIKEALDRAQSRLEVTQIYGQRIRARMRVEAIHMLADELKIVAIATNLTPR